MIRCKNSERQLLNEILLNVARVEQIIAALRADEYCNRIFAYYEFDIQQQQDKDKSNTGNTDVAPEIGEPSESIDDDLTLAEQEEAYAASISDPDYTDEGLRLHTVTGAIRKDPMRIRVTGVIDTVGKLFKLLTEIGFRCTNRKCSERGRWRDLDKVTVDEIPLKGQLIERLDLVFIFRKPQTEAENNAFADNMYRLSTKRFNLDFIFLRKYIYCILNNPILWNTNLWFDFNRRILF